MKNIENIMTGIDRHERPFALTRHKDERGDFVQLEIEDSGRMAHLALDLEGIRELVKALSEVIN